MRRHRSLQEGFFGPIYQHIARNCGAYDICRACAGQALAYAYVMQAHAISPAVMRKRGTRVFTQRLGSKAYCQRCYWLKLGGLSLATATSAELLLVFANLTNTRARAFAHCEPPCRVCIAQTSEEIGIPDLISVVHWLNWAKPLPVPRIGGT